MAETRAAAAPPSYFLPLLQLCDSALPTGAFSHSFGLETYLERGAVHDEATFGRWLQQFIGAQLVHCDGLAIRLGTEALERAAANPAALEDVWILDRMVTALALPLQLRTAGITMGRRMQQIGTEIFPTPALAAYGAEISAGRCAGHTALAFALVTHGLRVPLAQALQAYIFSTATALTQNAVRAIPLGQRAGQRVLRLMHDDAAAAGAAVMALQPEDLGAVAPGLEIAQMRHEHQRARMFMS